MFVPWIYKYMHEVQVEVVIRIKHKQIQRKVDRYLHGGVVGYPPVQRPQGYPQVLESNLQGLVGSCGEVLGQAHVACTKPLIDPSTGGSGTGQGTMHLAMYYCTYTSIQLYLHGYKRRQGQQPHP